MGLNTALVPSLLFLYKKSRKSGIVEIRSKGSFRTGDKDAKLRYRSVPLFEGNDILVLFTNMLGFPFLFRVIGV